MLSSSLNKQQITVDNTLTNQLFETIGDLNKLLNAACPTQFDISSQVPLWVVVEKNNRESEGTNSVTIYDFLQKYYDWLYCDNSIGAQYQLAQRLLDLVDVEKTRSVFLERLTTIYADGFDTGSLRNKGGLINENNLRKFLKSIRTTFYHKKTTENGIKYFFERLYGIDQEDIQITVPKKIMLRLNGGRFYDSTFSFPTGTTGDYDKVKNLSGSYLNGSRLQDSNWIQDWSYLLKVGIPAYQYKQNYINIAHPAGMKVVFEKTLLDYRGPTFDDTANTICDSAQLNNYAPYRINFDYSGYTASSLPSYWLAVPGLSLYGLDRGIGCCGASYSGFTGTTHVFPNWSQYENYSKNNFKDINISTMFELCYPQDTTSPNSGFVCS